MAFVYCLCLLVYFSISSFSLFKLLALTLAFVLDAFIKGMELYKFRVKEDKLNLVF